MNPTIHSRWGLLCPSCQKPLINPNQPWPTPCPTCGQRTHNKCLTPAYEWLVDLDIDMDPNHQARVCSKCYLHAQQNVQLIERIPHASGTQLQDIYKHWKAQQPPTPPRPVHTLWGPYRIDPDNFVPAVSKVLDIVHSNGPKVRWAVKLGGWSQVPMTNLASKEITLPNYFDSPNGLGRTHQEILDAMTGAALHEAGHAAYDSAELILEAQKRIKAAPGQSTWAAATCLNIVCDYNLERKVIERYPAFRHYYSECHRWSVRDTLPEIVNAMQDPDAQDRLNIRLAVVTWEMLGPGDLEAAGAVITPKLKWITKKCFDILKYSYTKGYLDTEPGKLKTARAIYELVRVINPIGAPANQPQPQPQGTQTSPPPSPTTCGIPGDPDSQPGQPGQGSPQQGDDESEQQGSAGTPSDESTQKGDQTSDDSTEGRSRSSRSQDGEEDDGSDAPGTAGEPDDRDDGQGESSGGIQEAAPETPEAEESGSREPDDDGTGSDTPGDGDADGEDGTTDEEYDDEQDSEPQDVAQGQDDDDGSNGDQDAGQADNTGSEDESPEQSGVGHGESHRGGKAGSETPVDPADDPFTGAGDLQDDPGRRKNSKKDALDDLEEQNQGQDKDTDEQYQRDFNNDKTFDHSHRQKSDEVSHPPEVRHQEVPDYQRANLDRYHAARVRELNPVISRLKKILRFRNADWGGMQTGRRSGTLTRRHVARLSNFGSDKVFHKTKPDETPKVRIGLLIDESESMRGGQPIEYYIGARNAATALTEALHGIRGVKLWSWGFSLQREYAYGQGGRARSVRQIPNMRMYVDPFHQARPSDIETSPMFGGTPTGEAMEYAAEVLLKNSTPDEKKVIFIITDGEAGGYIETSTPVRKYWGKITFVHIGIGATVDKNIPYYVGPVTDITLLPDLLNESVSEILR